MLRFYQEIVPYFLKYPFQDLPVIYEGELSYLINKNRFLKLIHKHNLLEAELDHFLEETFTYLDEVKLEKFFHGLKKLDQKLAAQTSLPVFFWKNSPSKRNPSKNSPSGTSPPRNNLSVNLSIKPIPLTSFFREYQVITTLGEKHLAGIWALSRSPIFISNVAGEIIYKNKAFSKMENAFFSAVNSGLKLGLDKKDKAFKSKALLLVKSMAKKKLNFFTINFSEKNSLAFQLEKIALPEGLVFLFTVFPQLGSEINPTTSKQTNK